MSSPKTRPLCALLTGKQFVQWMPMLILRLPQCFDAPCKSSLGRFWERKPGNLGPELNDLVGKTYNGTMLTKNFADNAYVIKEAGNQAAHPDKDPDLLDFSPQDADDLQSIFMELVSDLFVIPAATAKARLEFLARRKISPSQPQRR